jgi:hypothetical protein
MNTTAQTDQDLIDQAVIHVAQEVENINWDNIDEYLEDVLSIVEVHEKPMGAEPDKKYLEYYKLLVSFGGPNIWVHAYSHHTEVIGFWGSSKHSAWCSNDVIYDFLSTM